MDEKELAGKTVAELKDLAKEKGIEHISGMKKAELVAALTAKGTADSPAAPKAQEGASSKAKSEARADTQRPEAAAKDIPALKQEKRSLKAQISEAVAAGDRARTHQLRRRKAEIRRILNRIPAPPAPPPKKA